MLKKQHWLALATAGGVALCAVPAWPAGLGTGSGGAVLGQPLAFAIAVRLDTDELLAADCLLAEVHLGDRRLMPSQVQVRVEAMGPQTARVQVQTRVSVDEPVVTIELTAACSQRVSRRYVVLADLPAASVAPAAEGVRVASISLPNAGVAEEQPLPTAGRPLVRGGTADRRGLPAVGPEPVALRASALRSVALRQPAASTRAPRRAQASALPKTQLSAPTTSKPALRRLRRNAPSLARLRLDMAEPMLAVGGPVDQALQAVAQATATARQAASAASAAADRIAALERKVDQLRDDAQNSRSQAALLRDRLAHAESPAATWIWGTVAVGLALVAAWLWLRLSALRKGEEQGRRSAMPDARQASQAADAAERPPTAAMAFVHSDLDTAQMSAPRTRPAPAWPPPAPLDGWEPSQQDDAELGRRAQPDSFPQRPMARLREAAPEVEAPQAIHASDPLTPGIAPATREAHPVARDVSIDELLDLEQQAEFFVVLGQDDAAIELLVEHLRHTGGSSPLPYLKLLEIHRRRGDRSDYERMRARFNHRFNAYAPEWEVDLQSGRLLCDYPAVLPRLQQVWARPLDSMEELEALVFRKTNGELFELPAYREVLFLYALARDLLDHEPAETGSVDLLLPLSDRNDFSITSPLPFMELGRGQQQVSERPESRIQVPVDLDLSFGAERQSSIFDPLEESPTHPRVR